MNYPKALKILGVGGDKTFKSTLCKTIVGKPITSTYTHTVGINIYKSTIQNRSIIFWDIPFSEYKLGRNLMLIKQQVDGVVLMTNKDVESSFDAAKDWMQLFAKTNTEILIVKDIKEDNKLRMKYDELRQLHQIVKDGKGP